MQEAINVAARDWGLQCLRYEISELFSVFFFVGDYLHILFCLFIIRVSPGDIMPPHGVRVAMEMQAEAERKKRAQILESEGNTALTCTS